jgi:O-antigen/teichoic acid export membrane protein
MSPLILVARRQGQGMVLTALSLGAQIIVLLLLVPRFGVLGAGIGYLAVELLFGTLLVSRMAQRAAGMALDWRPAATLIGAAAAAALLVDRTPLAGQWTGGALAMLLTAGAIALLLHGRRRASPCLAERPA